MSNASEILFGTWAASPGSNVFEVVQKALCPKVFAATPNSYVVQLWVIIGLYCVEIALFAIALLLRAYQEPHFPIFRLSSTARGTYIVPHFALARFHLTLNAFYPLNAQLLADGASFSPAEPPAQIQQRLAALVEPFQTFLDRHRSFNIAWRAGWAVWLFATLEILVIWIVVGSTYWRRLSHELRDVEQEYAAFRLGPLPSAGRPRSPPPSSKFLRRAYRDMALASILIVLGGALCAGDSLFLLVIGSARAFQPPRYETATLLALYYPVISGVPLSIIAVSRAVKYKPTPNVVALGGMTSEGTPPSTAVP
ncbi:hypothetical protein JCM21900_000715 [Sporobolomyces salmonicolor]